MIFSLTLVLAPQAVVAEEILLTLVRVTDDHEAPGPVPSEIVHFLPMSPEQPIPIGETDAKGELSLTFTCERGTKVQARPIDAAFMYSRKRYCSETINFQVPTILVQKRLQRNMDKAAEDGAFAIAALAATELASMEMRETGQIAGEQAELLSVIYAAKALDVANGVTFDEAQSRAVMSLKMQDVLREYQVTAGIEVTGQLDYNTLSTMSGITSGALRHSYYQPDAM